MFNNISLSSILEVDENIDYIQLKAALILPFTSRSALHYKYNRGKY